MAEDPIAGEEPRRTGDARVDAALDTLAQLAGAAPAEQVRGYDEVHRRLAAALADLPET